MAKGLFVIVLIFVVLGSIGKWNFDNGNTEANKAGYYQNWKEVEADRIQRLNGYTEPTQAPKVAKGGK